MLDFLELSKHLGKDKPNLTHLEFLSYNKSGFTIYTYKGVHLLKIHYNEATGIIKIKGSLPYFINGQNFAVSKNDYINGIKYLETILNIKLTNAYVDSFEFGKIAEVQHNANHIINNHFAPPGMTTSIYTNGRYFKDNLTLLKLYNAKKNIFNKLNTATQKQIEAKGFDRKKEYVKFEVKHLKPHITINNGLGLIVSDLANSSFEKRINENFMSQYNRVKKAKTIITPDNKKQLSAGNIILLSLEETALQLGKTAKEIIYQKLKDIPAEVLNINDIKARQKQFRKMLQIIERDEKSKFDLSELL